VGRDLCFDIIYLEGINFQQKKEMRERKRTSNGSQREMFAFNETYYIRIKKKTKYIREREISAL
jgi:hypothetical protein